MYYAAHITTRLVRPQPHNDLRDKLLNHGVILVRVTPILRTGIRHRSSFHDADRLGPRQPRRAGAACGAGLS